MNSVYLKYNNFDSLDPSKLDQLINLGKDIDEDVLGQLIQIHQETTDGMLVEMQQHLTMSRFEDMKRCAHKFKSSSANLGLMRLHKLCGDFENELAATLLATSVGTEKMGILPVQEFVEAIAYECRQTNQKLNTYKTARVA